MAETVDIKSTASAVPPGRSALLKRVVVPRAGFEASYGGQARTPLRLPDYGRGSGF